MTGTSNYKVFSFDGGGMKGIFSAYFMKDFCIEANIAPNEIYKTANILAGSSIGGIAALGYAFGKSPDDMIAFFRDQGPKIFANPPSNFTKLYKMVTGGTFYTNDALKAALTQVFGNTKMFQLQGNVIITSVKTQTTKDSDGLPIVNFRPVLFSNMSMPGLEGQNYFVRDVALATAAAPIYFPAVIIPQAINDLQIPGDPLIKFIDGGTYCNNPAGLEWALANVLAPSVNRICVLSVGTGLGTIGFFDPTPAPVTISARAAKRYPVDSKEKQKIALANVMRKKGYTEEDINKFVELGISIINLDNMYLIMDLIDIGITGPQEAVNKQLQWLSAYGSKINNKDFFYYRFQTIFDSTKDTDIDNASQAIMDYYHEAETKQYGLDSMQIAAFIQKLNY